MGPCSTSPCIRRTCRVSFPQHSPGLKHQRSIRLESWQHELLEGAPFAFIRGCIRSDGCVFVNCTKFTGPSRTSTLSYQFSNMSKEIVDLFVETCDRVGVFTRVNRNPRGLWERADQSACERCSDASARRTQAMRKSLDFEHPHAAVAELVYARRSGRRGRKPLEVRILSAALSGLRFKRRIEGPLLSSRADAPLSSRGLGRRILSPETRVRIPVAVPRESAANGRILSNDE